MNISPKQRKLIESSVLSFSTVGRGNQPHIIYVACVKVIGTNKILITDNFMKETVSNLRRNPKVSLALLKGNKGFEFKGVSKCYPKGSFLKLARSLPENKGFACKNAIVVTVSKIKEMV